MKLPAAALAAAFLVASPAAAQTRAPQDAAAPAGHAGIAWAGTPSIRGSEVRWADYPMIRHVYTGSPAERAGLRVGDLILRINDVDGTDPAAYAARSAGDEWRMVVQRGAREIEVVVVLAELTWPTDEYTPPGSRATRTGP